MTENDNDELKMIVKIINDNEKKFDRQNIMVFISSTQTFGYNSPLVGNLYLQ